MSKFVDLLNHGNILKNQDLVDFAFVTNVEGNELDNINEREEEMILRISKKSQKK